MTTIQRDRVPAGVPSGGRFSAHRRQTDVLTLDGPINPGWSWTEYDSTEFARRHRALAAGLVYRAEKAQDVDTMLYNLGGAAAHAEFATAIADGPYSHPGTWGSAAASMIERERQRPWISQLGPVAAEPMTPERRTQLIEHFALRFVEVSRRKASGATPERAADGALDGYWSALHLMAPSRSRDALEAAAERGESDRRTLALIASGRLDFQGD
tara:strand:- start:291 stop:929 length:639 start_codon:yes stop_codon:yes gene_type:complete